MAKKKKVKEVAAPQKPLTLPERMPLKFRVAVSLFILLATLCLLYPELVFQNKVILAGDVEAAASFATPIKKAIQEGESDPLWNPYLYSGMPSYGSLSYLPGVYPVSLLTGLLSRIGFPNFTWLLFHIFMLGVGVWLLLFDRGVHFLIAAGAGALMMWMPNQVAVGVHGHGSQACAVAYMPFVLLFWDRVWCGKGVLVNASVLVVLLGFQLLRGHLQIAYYTFAILGLHFIFFAFLKIRDGWKGEPEKDTAIFSALARVYEKCSPRRRALIEVGGAAAVLLVVVVAAVLISAVLFLPVEDYAQYSIRGASKSGGLDYDYATSWSLHPAESLTFIVPFAFGFGKSYYFGKMPFTDYPNYLGIVTVFFAIVALILVRTRFVKFLLFLTIVTTVVAFGRHLPILYNPLFKFMPYFDKFRVPVMVLIVQQLSVVLLFGIGLQAALKANPEKGRRKALLAAGGAVGMLLLVLVSYSYWNGSFPQAIARQLRFVRSAPEQLQFARDVGGHLYSDLIKMSLMLTIVSTMLLLAYRRSVSALAVVLVVLSLSLADLFMVDRYIIHPEKLFPGDRDTLIKDKSERDRFLEPDPLIEYLEAQEEPFRVFPMTHPQLALQGDFRTNRYMNFAISSIGGYHPAKLKIYDEFLEGLSKAFSRGNLQLLDMLNVRYIISGSELPDNPVWLSRWQGTDYRGEKKFIYENVNSMPRVRFVDNFVVQPGSAGLDMIVSGTEDLTKTVVLDREPAIAPVSAEGATATITRARFNDIAISASLPSAAIMVLSEIYYPRWGVQIDGRPGEILNANHILRAVALPAGDHELVFRYDDSLLVRARIMTRMTLLITLVVLAGALFVQLKGRGWKLSS